MSPSNTTRRGDVASMAVPVPISAAEGLPMTLVAAALETRAGRIPQQGNATNDDRSRARRLIWCRICVSRQLIAKPKAKTGSKLFHSCSLQKQ